MKIIDATNLKLGRLASYSAKALLEGEELAIVNAERAVIVGRKKDILHSYKEKRDKGSRYKGPFFPKRADRIIKRTVRGMLPYKKAKGQEAFKRIRVYLGVPEEYKGKELESIKGAKLIGKEPDYFNLGDLSKQLGAKYGE